MSSAGGVRPERLPLWRFRCSAQVSSRPSHSSSSRGRGFAACSRARPLRLRQPPQSRRVPRIVPSGVGVATTRTPQTSRGHRPTSRSARTRSGTIRRRPCPLRRHWRRPRTATPLVRAPRVGRGTAAPPAPWWRSKSARGHASIVDSHSSVRRTCLTSSTPIAANHSAKSETSRFAGLTVSGTRLSRPASRRTCPEPVPVPREVHGPRSGRLRRRKTRPHGSVKE